MIHVFSTEITPRIVYSFRLVFETLLSDQVTFYDEIQEYTIANQGIQLNYSDQSSLPGLWLKPYGLLHETHLQAHNPLLFDWDGEKAFFEVAGGFLPFDLFAASFFMVSRYEEYLPGKRDEHQRFRARESFAARHALLEKAIVNRWVLKLAQMLEQQFPAYHFKRSSFHYQPTIDIDNAWAFRNKGVFRTCASCLRDILKGNGSLFRKRLKVLMHIDKDPYDQYTFLENLFTKYHLQPVYFLLMHNHGPYDRSLSPRNRNFKELIRRLSARGEVGIHPSYASNKRKRQLQHEIALLHKITGKQVSLSRQHFLKLNFPTTYRRLMAEGILHDYSMGFPSRPGFRAGIATPFLFFDLLDNEISNLTIHPFQVMDVTLKQYRGLNIVEAKHKIEVLMHECARVGGTFVSLWHNESLSDTGQWEDWREVYTYMTRLAANLSNEYTADTQ